MEKVMPKRKLKSTDIETDADLEKMDKKELLERIKQLEAQNFQLKNIIAKKNDKDATKHENKRRLDFNKCHFRKILLRIMYFGWDYNGLAVQDDSTNTIEHHLFNALNKSCLIECREKSDYHRCGRTDKGVSSFGQVLSLKVRSNFPPDKQKSMENIKNEMAYCKILNRLLPEDIRAISWMPCPDDGEEFSARFNCKRRVYKYYFPKSNLNIDSMKEACILLVGTHDFRNLCKMDVKNGVTAFVREIFAADILPVNESNDATSMYYLRIEGNAFLWHQIRCIFGVLLLIGQGNEDVNVIKALLDIETNPRKPQYSMALHVPLNLFRCDYEINDWIYEKDELKNLIKQVQQLWSLHSIKTTMIEDCLKNLEDIYKVNFLKTQDTEKMVNSHSDVLLQGVKSKIYKPLLKRDTCSSLQERIEYYTKKRKIDDTVKMETQE